MANFKIGQKVVFVRTGEWNPECIMPKENEIITLHCISPMLNNHWGVVEYPIGYDGQKQYICDRNFRPLSDDFADETLAKISEGIQEIKEIEKYILVPETLESCNK